MSQKKNLLYIIVGVIVLIIIGVGIGYSLYKAQDKNIQTENKTDSLTENTDSNNKKFVFSCEENDINVSNDKNNIEIKYSNNEISTLIINNKNVTNLVNEQFISSAEFYNDLILLKTSGTSGGYGNLYIFDNNGSKLFDYQSQNQKLFFIDYTTSKNKITLQTSYRDEEAEIENDLGKLVYEEMNCNELEEYKDKIISKSLYEINYNEDGTISEMKNIQSIYLKDETFFSDYKISCNDNE